MTDIKIIGAQVTTSNNPVSLRCPSCRHIGQFTPFGSLQDIYIKDAHIRVGHRYCPNNECRTHVFVVIDTYSGIVLNSYPQEVIEFNPENIPPSILKTFEEAIICHSHGCFVSSAIMIRRTLEELCAEKGATGKDLKDRIAALKSNVILPEGLLEGLDSLRLLGNDAAHLEAKTYKEIGEEELDIAVEITKEILKSVYQLGSLVQRLKALSKASA